MMKTPTIRPRAALFIGAALLATPAFAQEAPAPQSVTPPPILVSPAQAPAPTPQVQMAPSAPIVQPAPPPGPAPAPRAERPAATRAAPVRAASRAAPVRQTAPASATAPAAPPAAAPAPAPAPVAEAPAPATVAPEPAAPAPVTETTTQTATSTGPSFAWPWLLGGLLLLAAGVAALLLMRRRSDETETEIVETPVYEQPVASRAYQAPVAAAPIVAAPVIEPRHEPEVSPYIAATPAAVAVAETTEAHVEAELAEPETSDLAGVTDAPAPVSNRPWLEFGLRPVRAGTSEEEALVDVELTVGNAGDVPARDVRISTFMLADAEGSEMEGLLTGNRGDSTVPPVTIAPGDGTRVDAHLAVPKGELGRVFNPVVVAEARYTLPDGSEGRTSAAFKIGRPSQVEDGVGPIGASRPHMVDNVEAELLGTPEHA
ncbi:hypothetical protein [Sphingomonas sp. LM7]|uniref:hypothetical protein n=1 Tax=Sphingomonas sp. LM7 TaxID=1938607 RepID=UPI000983EDD6|nr:hypothetical protein [Sphingomonas sp. LM7]AQR72353.1 hypothetical protein BXU08_00540 [Sphingomonas sp. LM7]